LQHHPREDLAFEIVRERHPKLAKLVDALTAEHVIAVEKSSQLVADLDSVVNGAILPRDKVEMPGREYIAHFRHHMVKEEAELFKLVEQTLTDDDWKAIDAKLKPLVDPLFGTHAKEQYAALRREIASEAGVPADD
jgi:hemerythrin-like domain-containing protein